MQGKPGKPSLDTRYWALNTLVIQANPFIVS